MANIENRDAQASDETDAAHERPTHRYAGEPIHPERRQLIKHARPAGNEREDDDSKDKQHGQTASTPKPGTG